MIIEEIIQSTLEQTIKMYIKDVKERGFIPNFNSFCQLYFYEPNETNFQTFERIINS